MANIYRDHQTGKFISKQQWEDKYYFKEGDIVFSPLIKEEKYKVIFVGASFIDVKQLSTGLIERIDFDIVEALDLQKVKQKGEKNG